MAQTPPLNSRTAIFTKRVHDYMRVAPAILDDTASCEQVVRAMAMHKTTAALLLNPGQRVTGIMTEQDVVRRIGFHVSATTPIREVMTCPVKTISTDDFLYQAIARMQRFHLRHMPVIDHSGVPVGMLNLEDALAVAAEETMEQIGRLYHEDNRSGLHAVKTAQVELAEELFLESIPTPEIQAVLTHINNDIYRRLSRLNLEEMATEDWGEPPVDFCVIVMGSGGRGESFLHPDQDNGFILDDYPDRDHDRIDAFFIELAKRLTHDLDQAGFPLCKGYVMASNPLWRKTISQWCQQTTLWCKHRSTVALRLSDIFYDFQPVFGAVDLAARLRHHVIRQVSRSPVYLQAMYADDVDHGTALGWFDRFITVKNVKSHKGAINLKHTGTLPLVEAVRLMSLRHGIVATPTLLRLNELRDTGQIDADETDYLTGAYEHITHLLLRLQIRDFKAGKKISNYMQPKTMTHRERDLLIDSFKAINRFRDRVRTEFTGDVF